MPLSNCESAKFSNVEYLYNGKVYENLCLWDL